MTITNAITQRAQGCTLGQPIGAALGSMVEFTPVRMIRECHPDDGAHQTIWQRAPHATALDDKSLEVVLPTGAELTSLDAALLATGALPAL